jgi:orotidine-5'-phosphate decarboxylase|tara:strand:- start:1038 stop:1865 length:828 start_codon:yes stop_codon:yes gene_type:complete
MNQKKLFEQIKKKRSFLSIGLDVDLKKIPPHLLSESDPIFSFCKKIIDSTNKYAIAYKPNIAFFESYGAMGWKSLEKVSDYLSSKYPEIFSIADAKRGDIGNTAYQYARAFFENLSFDSITVNPYMGRDSVEPFLSFKDKSTILLTLTSNYGADDFQFFGSPENPLFERVIEVSKSWNNSNRLMYVIGANQINQLKKIRGLLPDSFFLIPGVGAQGGDLIKVILNGINDKCGLIINSSRQIIYADSGLKFQKYAKDQAIKMQEEMEKQLLTQGII